MLTDCWLNLLSFGGKCNDAPGNQCEKYKSFHLITVNACQTCHLRSFRGGGEGLTTHPPDLLKLQGLLGGLVGGGHRVHQGPPQ